MGKGASDEERVKMETQAPADIENKDEALAIHRLEPLLHPMIRNTAKI